VSLITDLSTAFNVLMLILSTYLFRGVMFELIDTLSHITFTESKKKNASKQALLAKYSH
jgi:hypothetical protein